MACANASVDHKLKLVCIGKSKNPRSFKGTNMRVSPVAYYNQTKAWMTQSIFEKWFFDEFVPKVRAYLRANNLPEKAILFLDNAPAHPEATKLASSDGLIFVQYFPPNVTSLLQPMDQGVLEAMKLKRRYRKILLRNLLEDEGNVKLFYKKWSIKDAIIASAESWEDLPAITIQRSWRQLYPYEEARSDDNLPPPNTNAQDINSFLTIVENLEGFIAVDETNIAEWLSCDAGQPGYQVEDDDAIIEEILESQTLMAHEELLEEEAEDEEGSRIPLQTASENTEGLLNFLEQENDSNNYPDIVTVRKIRTRIKMKMCQKTKQLLMTDFFNS